VGNFIPMKTLCVLSALLAFVCVRVEAQHEDRFGVHLIAVRTEAEAIDILRRLNAGQKFADLARSRSIDPSARAGGYMGTIALRDLRPEFQDALNGVGPGQVNRIARVGQTYFLLLLSPDEEGRAAQLMEAATKGDAATVKRLVAAGADPNARFENGSTVLMNATFLGHLEVVGVLLASGSEVNATLADGSTALMAASLGGHSDIVRILIDAGAQVRARTRVGATALTEASHAGHIDVVRILLAAGAEVNASLTDGTTALMAAALGGHPEVVRTLVAAGAQVNRKDSRGWTALTYAAASTKTSTVRALVDGGAGANIEERLIMMGSTYVNEYYASNEARLLDLATTEFQSVLAANSENVSALLWMGAVEFLRWGETPSLEQFRKANSLLRRSADLDPNDAQRHYWVAATNSIFASRATGLTETESAAILNEGIDHARKAIAVDPTYSSAMAYLSLLYKQRADRAFDIGERSRFLMLSQAAADDVVKSGNRPPPPNDQFSRPAAPPPPELPPIAQ
jgi:ankyrin repeat protein